MPIYFVLSMGGAPFRRVLSRRTKAYSKKGAPSHNALTAPLQESVAETISAPVETNSGCPRNSGISERTIPPQRPPPTAIARDRPTIPQVNLKLRALGGFQ